MKYATCSEVQTQLSFIQKQIQNKQAPFKDFIADQQFQQKVSQYFPDYRDRIFSPITTLLAFLSQVLCPDHSCQQAVANVNAERIAQGFAPISLDTGAYCKARNRLSEEFIHELVRESGQKLENQVPEKWLWKGRHVKLVDGSTVSMPDTTENQSEYPQQKAQKEGLGFPLARILAIISLSTGAVLDLAIGSYQGKLTGEHALLRRLLGNFNNGDVMLADAYYCSYFLIAALQRIGVDLVCRIHGAKGRDFRKGKRLGDGDHIVNYYRPTRPKWMDEETYQSFPKTIEVREVKVHINISGFRTRCMVVVTTMTDSKTATKIELAELYRDRWNVELKL